MTWQYRSNSVRASAVDDEELSQRMFLLIVTGYLVGGATFLVIVTPFAQQYNFPLWAAAIALLAGGLFSAPKEWFIRLSAYFLLLFGIVVIASRYFPAQTVEYGRELIKFFATGGIAFMLFPKGHFTDKPIWFVLTLIGVFQVLSALFPQMQVLTWERVLVVIPPLYALGGIDRSEKITKTPARACVFLFWPLWADKEEELFVNGSPHPIRQSD